MSTAQKTVSRKGNETTFTFGSTRDVVVAATLIFFLSHSPLATADGFRLPNQDPEAIARGNAFVATADNPSAIYYNPAGITQLEGQNVSAGLYVISTDGRFEQNGTGNTAETRRDWIPVPQLYYVNSLSNCPISFGVGVYAPYGLGIDYGDPSFRTVAQNGNLLYATVNPVIAWKITPELSIAAGPTINYSKVQFNQGVGFTAADRLHLVGDDYDFGFNAGAFWHPLEQWAFGLNYHSSTKMNYQGHSTLSGTAGSPLLPPGFVVDGSNPLSATVYFPQYVVSGFSYRPTTNWNLEFDLDWTDWHATKGININGNLGATGGAIPSLPLNYRSSFMYDFGITRQLGHGYFASIGFIYSENSSPSANYNPVIPDSDLYLYNAGIGHHGEHWGWAFSYTVAVNPSRFVNGSSFGPSVDGTYRTLNQALNGSISLKF